MKITQQQLDELSEKIQDDLIVILDGFDDDLIDDVCQAVVEKIAELSRKLNENCLG